MNVFNRAIDHIDAFQRRHKTLAFAFAIIKKHNDDQAGYQAALVTYYGFFSLFPLLLVLTTLAGVIGHHRPELGQDLVTSVRSYFPVFGDQLDRSIKGLNKSGFALTIGILFTLYGARGIADAFRNAANHIWHVPLAQRSGFPRSWLRNFAMIIFGGAGFLTASVLAGWTTSTGGHALQYRILSAILNFLILYLVFVMILRLSLPLNIKLQKFRLGAAISAVGLTLLQTLGGFLVLHEAHHLSESYSALAATTLGLMAWIYLQVQVLMYAVIIDTVRDGRLWPRSFSGRNLTPADHKMKEVRVKFWQ